MTDEAWKLAAINHAVRELLGGPDEATLPGPFSGARLATAVPAEPAITPGGTMRVPAPDSGWAGCRVLCVGSPAAARRRGR